MAGGIFPPAFSARESSVGNFRKPFPLGNRSSGTSESHFRSGIDRRKLPKAISDWELRGGNSRKPFPLGNRAAGTPESHFRSGIDRRELPKAISDCVTSFHRHTPALFLFANYSATGRTDMTFARALRAISLHRGSTTPLLIRQYHI